jgi:hypothetical protein
MDNYVPQRFIQQPSSNPYLTPSADVQHYTDCFKEFPISIPQNLPFFPTTIYKMAIIKSAEQMILEAISNAHGTISEYLNHPNTAFLDFEKCEDIIQHGLIKPVAYAMQPIMNILSFQQQLCWILSEFNTKSRVFAPYAHLGIVVNTLVEENVEAVLEQIATKSSKSAFSLIQELVKEKKYQQQAQSDQQQQVEQQSMQTAKVMYSPYLSPVRSSQPNPSTATPSSSSAAMAEKLVPSYPTVKNIPPELADRRRLSGSFVSTNTSSSPWANSTPKRSTLQRRSDAKSPNFSMPYNYSNNI